MLISSTMAMAMLVASPTSSVAALPLVGAEAPFIAPLPVDMEQPVPPAPTPAEQPAADTPPTDAPSQSEAAPQSQTPDDAPPAAMVLRDPWEKPNRAIWDFDIFFEKKLLGPVAHGYMAIAPQVVRTHLSNAITNLDEPLTTLNALLQMHVGRAVKSGLRFIINSTIGVAGLFDVAAQSGLPARRADFGQTLARWGAKPGPYVVIPFLGPSNVRDGFGRLVDTLSDPVGFVIGGIFTSTTGAGRFAAGGVNWRQDNEATMKAIYGASDPYAFTRSAYGQQRAAIVQDSTGKVAALPDF
jgi:phospholipid-binding lipoprotein MlaA